MNSFSKLIAFFSLILLCSNTFASEVGGTYFRSQGKEVAVEYTIDNYRNPTSVMFITTCNSESECTGYQNMDILLEDFVKAIKYKRFYTYKYVEEPCLDLDRFCAQPKEIEDPESSNISSLNNSENDYIDTYGRSTTQAPRNPGTLQKVHDGAATQAGSSSVNAIIEQLKKNSSNDVVSLYTFRVRVVGSQRIPTELCRLDDDGFCVPEKDVTVTNYNTGQIAIDYGRNWTSESREREDNIGRMLERLKYKCDIAYTGTSPRLVGHLVCYYAP